MRIRRSPRSRSLPDPADRQNRIAAICNYLRPSKSPSNVKMDLEIIAISVDESVRVLRIKAEKGEVKS